MYSLILSKVLHANIDLHHKEESEAPEVEFVELSEDPQETEEVLDLIPIVEEVFEDTNLAGTKGSPNAFIPTLFIIVIKS